MIPTSVCSSVLLNPTSSQTIKPELVFIIVQLDSLLIRALELVWKAVLLAQIPMHNLFQEFVNLHVLHLHISLTLLTNVYSYVPMCQSKPMRKIKAVYVLHVAWTDYSVTTLRGYASQTALV